MKHNLLLAVSLLLSVYLFAGNITSVSDLPAYYSGMNNTSGQNLVSALNTICNNGYSGISYGSGKCTDCVWGAYGTTDLYPTDPDYPGYVEGKAGKIWDIYSNCTYTFQTDQGSSSATECTGGYNREHSLPKSWFGGGTAVGPGTDLYHIYPTDVHVNTVRSNNPYGEVSETDGNTTIFSNGSMSGSCVYPTSYSGTVFEPADQYKGDLARGYMYMVMKWAAQGTSLAQAAEGTIMFNSSVSSSTNYGLTQYSLDLLMKWHRQDPVSQKEIDRNNAVQSIQGNRNPFIDYPCLAEYLWGNKKNETVIVADLIGSFSDSFIQASSDGCPCENPTIQVSPAALDFGAVAQGQTQALTITVLGINLTSSVSLSLSGTNKTMFSLSSNSGTYTSTIAAANANGSNTVTLYYNPTAIGSHTATLTLSSTGAEDIVVSLSGSCAAARNVTWYVNGAEYTLGAPSTVVANGAQVTKLPTDPSAPSSCSDKEFVGWSETNIGISASSEPADLFNEPGASPYITKNTTFYAVFATRNAGVETSTSQTFEFTDKTWGDEEEAWTSNQAGYVYKGGVQITTGYSGAGATSNDSFYKVSSIVVTYRTNASAGAGTISATVGGTTKSGNITVSGDNHDLTLNFATAKTGNVTFSVACTTNSIYIVAITINYINQNGYFYSDHITQCEICTLTGITINSANAQTAFNIGDEFTTSGLIVTAAYSDCNSHSVSPTSVSAPDMSTEGDKTITVSYTESGVTKTATYTIHVYDFRALEATNVSSNSFTANWTEANADNYSLNVYQKTTTIGIENRDTTFIDKDFTVNISDWTINNISGYALTNDVWTQSSSYGAVGKAYNSGPYAAEAWLISPPIDLTNATEATLTLNQLFRYASTQYVNVTTDDGTHWTQLTMSPWTMANNWTYSNSTADLSSYVGNTIKIGLQYISTSSSAGTWEIKTFNIEGKYNKQTEVPATESVSGYPATITGTSAAVSGLESQTTYYYTVTPNGGTISNEIEVTTTAQAVINTYTITFCNEDGAVLQQTTCQEGATPVYSGATPSKTATAQYTYTFAGWSPDIAPATADQTYTAQFDATVNQYTLTVNGASGSGTYDYGTSVTLTPEPADNYHFTQWSDGNTDNPRIVNVTANATYTAQSEEDSKTTVYLFPTIWETDNAKFAAYVFEDGKAAAWSELMTATADGKAYTTQVYNYQNIIFVRLNKTATNGNWNDKWNQTADLTLNTSSHNCYQITGWGNNNSTGLWRNYPFYFVEFRDYDGSVLATDTVDNGNSATAPAAPSRTGYTFSGWDNSFNNVTADLTVTATYSANNNTAYKVEHYQQNILDDGYTLFETDNLTGVTDGNTAAAAKIYTGFTAQAFSQSTIAADGSTVVKVYYNRLVYEIKFVVEGSTMQTDNLPYGATPVFAGATPVKAATAQYTYTFAGWDTEIAVVTGNKTYTAVFTSVVNTYTITWKNEDGSVLETDLNVPYGATPSYDGATPAKAATAQYTYTFATWTPAVAAVTGDAVYTAVFTSVVNEYEVTFNANGHGTAPQSQTLAYGSKVVKPADPSVEGYTFGGWFKEATCTNAWDFNNETVSGAQTLFAKWVINQWTLTWDVNGGSALTGNYTHGLVNYGTTIVKPADPTMSGYTFTGWNPAVPATMPDADLTLVATWTESGNTPYKVEHYQQNILDDGYTLIETDNLTGKTGASITPVSKGYTGFSEPTYTAATIAADGSTVVKLYYNRLVYEIKFVVEGSTMQTDNLRYGAMPVFAGATPVKTATAQYTYTFAGWDTEIAVVTGNKTYTAVFTSVVNTYTITWKNEDGSVLETDLNVPYGATPSYDGATPAKAATAQYTYTFASWTPAVAAVTGDAVYTATFTSVVNEYEVTFNANGHGTAPQSQTLAYGSKVVKPADPSVEGYTFGGWFKEATCTNAWDFSSDIVKGNIELFAKWVINTHKLSWDAAGGTLSGNYTSGDAIAYGTVIIAPTATREGYNFSGWNPAFTEGMTMPDNDLSFIATWTEKGNIPYTVNHYQEALDGSWKLADTDNLTGTTGTNTAAVAKNYTGFTAQAFSQAAIAANGSTVVDIYYTRNSYTLTYRVDGVQSGNTETYKYGASVIARTEPAKEGYTFSGWDNVPSTMPANDVVVNGTFSINSYTLTYKVDGEVYKTYTVEYNSAITPEAEPTKTGYTFSGWDNVPSTMPANDVVVNGTFTVNSFSGVHFESSEGGTITVSPQQDSYNYGEEVVITAKPDEGYTFTGWEDANGNVISTETSIEYTVEGDATITAQFAPDTDTRYTVRHWLQNLENDEYTLDKEQNLTGTTATMTQAQADMYTGFIAKAFNQALISGDGKAVVDIYYDRQLFTILFVAEGETLQSSQYKYGATPAYNGTEPEKEGDAQYTYSFKGWTPEIVTVTADATYTAVFEQVVNTYVITFVNEDGNVLDEQTLAYGEMPEYRGETPEKAEDEHYTYSFSGWSPELAEVTGDAVYTAQFTATEKTPTGIESVIISGNSISGPRGMRIYDYTGKDVTGAKDYLYKGAYIIVVDGQSRKVMIP